MAYKYVRSVPKWLKDGITKMREEQREEERIKIEQDECIYYRLNLKSKFNTHCELKKENIYFMDCVNCESRITQKEIKGHKSATN